jgi:hypothetical protein
MPEKVVALVCLQAQRVAGLPAAAEGCQILLHLLQQQEQQTTVEARCRAGVADFHDQVLLLHCAPVDRMASVAVTFSFHLHNHHHHRGCIDLTAQLHRPSPSVLSFVLGGAVLSLTLHHRLITRRRRFACLPLPSIPDLLLLNCLRTLVTTDDDGQQSSSSGFITTEKGTISRRRPPSDNLLTTDDEGDGGKPPSPVALAEELEVENEFLARLEAGWPSLMSSTVPPS